MTSAPRLALVPLDERPATLRLPVLVAAVAGARVDTPPADALPSRRTPGDPDALANWLSDRAAEVNAAVVSLETLGYGGLIASRTGHEPAGAITARWDRLRELRTSAPDLRLYAASIVQRTPDADDADEEPEYWARHGRALHRLSALAQRAVVEPELITELAAARAAVPAGVRADFLRRRLRNHELNLHALGMAADGVVDALTIGGDDTGVAGIGSVEQQWLAGWIAWLELSGRCVSYPGADEIAAVLTARALLGFVGADPPRIAVHTAVPGGLDRVAPYESLPIRDTVAGQVRACGATAAAADTKADLHLVVHVPDGAGDWAINPPTVTDARTATAVADLATRLLDTGRPVAVADCAQPNGADPALASALTRHGALYRLAGYAGWNTAGNTLGSALAHAVAGHAGRLLGTFDQAAHDRLLRLRVAEDVGYQAGVRQRVRAELGEDPRAHNRLGEPRRVAARVEELLTRALTGPVDLAGWRIVPGSVRLPWSRTFEIDLDVAVDR